MATPQLYAVTVFGRDRPGIIAEVSAGLAGLGVDIEDSTMTLLGGRFAMMLLCSGEGSEGRIAPSEVEHALSPVTVDGDLEVSVRPVTDDPAPTAGGSSWTLTARGDDRPGIVSALVQEVASAGANITALTTRLSGETYLLAADLDLPSEADTSALEAAITAAAEGVGVTATLRPAETGDR